jgi:hypothetical protein
MTAPVSFQVVVDCDDPHELAEWWALTLGWTMEPTDEAFIRRMIDEGYASQDETRTWKGQLWWATGAAILHPEASGDAPARRILFQKVPEAKTVKNRAHLDLRVTAAGAELDAARDALLERGATYLHSASQGPHRWHTMADPEGNEFCIT